MKLLLDSHTLIYWTGQRERLSPSAGEAIAAAENQISVSVVTAWELAIKVKKGKLPGSAYLVANFRKIINDEGFSLLDITLDHALQAGSLERRHDDPFDRILAAQALAEGLVLVSQDGIFEAYGVRRLW